VLVHKDPEFTSVREVDQERLPLRGQTLLA